MACTPLEPSRQESRLLSRVKQQKVVADLGIQAVSGLSIKQLMKEVVVQLGATLDAAFSKIFELLSSKTEMLLREGVGWKPGYVGRVTVAADRNSLAGYTLMVNRPVIVRDLSRETRFRPPPLMREHSVVSSLTVVIHGRTGPWGVLGVDTSTPRAFSEDDTHFVQALANLLGAAIERRNTEQQLMERLRFQQGISAISSRIGEATNDLTDSLHASLADMGRLTEADSVQLYHVTNDRLALTQRGRWRPDEETELRETGDRLSLHNFTWLTGTLQSGGALYIPDMDAIPAFAISERQLFAKHGGRPLVVLPLTHEGKLTGFISLHNVKLDVGHLDDHITDLRIAANVTSGLLERQKVAGTLREANRTLQTLIATSPQAIVAFDNRGYVTEWNPAAEALFGWTKSEILGHPYPAVPSEGWEEFEHLLERKRRGEVLNGLVVRRRTKGGEPLDISVHAARIDDGNGKTTGFVAIYTDVTERNRFLRVATHELRNPLATIKAIVNLMVVQGRSDNADPPVNSTPFKEKLETLDREVGNFTQLMEAVFHAFRALEGELPFHSEPIDLGKLLNASLQPFLMSEERLFTLEGSDGEQIRVTGDPHRLSEVFRNLLTNAVKYSEPGTRVRIKIRRGTERVVVAVQDEGVGFPQQEVTRLFESFYRGSNVSGIEPGGMGLGLYLCRDIIDRHGGTIWGENNQNAGATFYVELPLAQADNREPLDPQDL